MPQTQTVLGQSIALADDAAGGDYVLIALVDIDDFELSRLAQGDHWAERVLGHVERVVDQHRLGQQTSVVRVPPDAWVVTLRGQQPGVLLDAGQVYASAVREHVTTAGQVKVTIGLSQAHTGATRVEEAAREAVLALDRKLVDGGNALYVFAESTANAHPVALPDRVEEALARCIRDGDAAGAVDALRSWIERVSRVEGVTPPVLRQWIAAELLYALDVAGRRRLADGSTDWIAACSQLSLDEILAMFDIHDRSYLVLWLERLLPRIVETQTPQSPARHVLALIEAHIHEHYAEDLHLITVAQAVFVSPYYISHLFQRELGTTFLKYLTAVRMQHGRRLLDEGDIPVETIAQRVGYGAPKRFGVLFKQTFGLTPSEYRRRMTQPSPSSLQAAAR